METSGAGGTTGAVAVAARRGDNGSITISITIVTCSLEL